MKRLCIGYRLLTGFGEDLHSLFRESAVGNGTGTLQRITCVAPCEGGTESPHA